MRIATWNVNSIRTRVGRVTSWLEHSQTDVLAMQEIKCKPDQFPYEAFKSIGYEVVAHGLNQWNGVAFASRIPAEDIELEFSGQPEFKDVVEARALGATFDGVRLWSLYVPHGRSLDDPHFQYKLNFLDALTATTAEFLEHEAETPLALMGDFNIAPLDNDVWDIREFQGGTHVSPQERQAFEGFKQIGLTDVVRPRIPGGYTYWDYQQLRFPKNEGMRIDFILGNEALADSVTDVSIERDEREGEGPSDHVPVTATIG